MIMAMVSFYLIGMFASFNLANIVEEQNKLKLETENKIREEEMLEKMKTEKLKKEQHLGTNLDLVTGNEIDDGFTPLDLSQAVKTKLKE
jgi:hypothetical protein